MAVEFKSAALARQPNKYEAATVVPIANVQATAIAGVTNVVLQAREDLMRCVLQAMVNHALFVSDLSPTQNEQLQAQVTAVILAGQHSLDAELRAIKADGNDMTRSVAFTIMPSVRARASFA